MENDVISFQTKGVSGHTATPKGTINTAYPAEKQLLEIPGISDEERNMIKCLNDCLAFSYGEEFDIEIIKISPGFMFKHSQKMSDIFLNSIEFFGGDADENPYYTIRTFLRRFNSKNYNNSIF